MALICIIAVAEPAAAQIRDGFEYGPARLQLWRSDAGAEITSQELTDAMPFTGQRSEAVEVNVGHGSFVHLIYPIRPAALIDELSCVVHLRAAASGLRVGLRVVLPRSTHPATGRPASVVVFGGSNEGRGAWSQLRVERCLRGFDAQVRVLNSSLGYSVDTANAFVDAVVFDVYNGPGSTRFQIDDLSLDGLIDAIAGPDASAIGPLGGATPPDVADVPTQLQRMAAGLPRWVQYRGENAAWLASLGFTGVLVEGQLPEPQLDSLRATGLAVIASPRGLVSGGNSSAPAGWLLKAAADASVVDAVRQAAFELDRLPDHQRRPKFVEAMESQSLFSRSAEVVAVPSPYPTVVASSEQAAVSLSRQFLALRNRSLPIVSSVIEPPAGLRSQRMAYRRNARGAAVWSGAADMADTDLLQARLSVLRGCMAGAKGHLFRTTRPLDTAEELGRARGMQAINAELEFLRPWITAASASPQTIPVGHPGWRAAAWKTDRSTLVLLTTTGEFDRIAAVGPTAAIDVVLPRGSATQRAYRVTHGDITSVQLAPRTDGWGLHLESPSICEQIVLTDDAVAVGYLREALPRYAAAALPHRIEAAEQQYATLQEVLNLQAVPADDPKWQTSQQVGGLLRESLLHQSRGQVGEALRDADRAVGLSASTLREAWLRAASVFPDPRSLPLLCSLPSLADHEQLIGLTAGRAWQSHSVPGGDFDSVDQMIAAGWGYEVRQTDTASHEVAVSADAGVDAGPALRLSAAGRGGHTLPGGFAGSTLRVMSPKIEVPAGRLLRIACDVRVERGSREPEAAVVVYDNYGTSTLGQPVAADAASEGRWQRFELFRISEPNAPLQLFFEVRGDLTATVDRVTLDSIILRPQAGYATTPVRAAAEDVPGAGPRPPQ